MGINLNLTGTNSAGGSVNSSKNISNAYSNTDAATARAAAAEEARKAHERQIELMKITQEFNAREAQKARDWEENLANTIYTRSIKNMKEAGINPILAASMGLSAASVGSGATASISTPSSFMGQGFMDTNSASHAEGSGYGSSWNNSESGLATWLTQMGELVMNVADKISNGMGIEFTINGLEDALKHDKGIPKPNSEVGKATSKTMKNMLGIVKNVVKKS